MKLHFWRDCVDVTSFQALNYQTYFKMQLQYPEFKRKSQVTILVFNACLQLYVILCLGATTDEPLANNSLYGVHYTKSFPCPVGYYCESGDIIPTPCPNKTYNPIERASQRENCLPCQVDHYNHLTGQAACFHCGGQASQPYLGQDRCQCNGLHRVFMVSPVVITFISLSLLSSL